MRKERGGGLVKICCAVNTTTRCLPASFVSAPYSRRTRSSLRDLGEQAITSHRRVFQHWSVTTKSVESTLVLGRRRRDNNRKKVQKPNSSGLTGNFHLHRTYDYYLPHLATKEKAMPQLCTAHARCSCADTCRSLLMNSVLFLSK